MKRKWLLCCCGPAAKPHGEEEFCRCLLLLLTHEVNPGVAGTHGGNLDHFGIEQVPGDSGCGAIDLEYKESTEVDSPGNS